MGFENKIRLPFHLRRPQHTVEEDIYLKANGQRVVQNVTIHKEWNGVTDRMPHVWHDRFLVAMKHDRVHIQSKKFTGYFRVTGATDPEWPEFMDYPLAPLTFKGFQENFAARSSRCDVCADDLNLILQDDTTTISEGEAYEVNVAANDFIGCDTPVFEIVSYNAAYLASASISAAGVLSFTVKEPVPSAPSVLIATYRVKCGTATATATLTAAVTGTGAAACPQPMNLTYTTDAAAAQPVALTMNWEAPNPAPTRYFYQVEKVAGGTLVAGAYVDGLTATVPSLGYNTAYRLRLFGVCQPDESVQAEFSPAIVREFTTPAAPAGVTPEETMGVYLYPSERSGDIGAEAYFALPVLLSDAVFISGTMTNLVGPPENRPFYLHIQAGQPVGRSEGIFEGEETDDFIITDAAIYPAKSKAQNENKIMILELII